jgi:hypothetical protein
VQGQRESKEQVASREGTSGQAKVSSWGVAAYIQVLLYVLAGSDYCETKVEGGWVRSAGFGIGIRIQCV